MPFGRFAPRAAIAAALAFATPAWSQSAECDRLRQAISDSASNANVGQYQAAAERQRAELDRMAAYAHSIGCDNRRFLFFGSDPPPQCGDIRQQMARMRANYQDLQGRAAGGARGDLIARYNARCANKPTNLLDTLFGGQHPRNNPENPDITTEPLTPEGKPHAKTTEASAGSQAVCVRACDGSFFPISYAASGWRYESLEARCRALCPNAEVSLYTYGYGGTIEQAVSTTGQRYMDSPNALEYRTALAPDCSCKPKGESWAQALAGAEAKLGPENKGDIIVTPQKSLEMSQPKPDAKPDPKAKNPKLAKSANSATTDINGVDTELSAQTQTISRESSGILGGADAGSAVIPEDQGKVREEKGPDGVMRSVRIISSPSGSVP
ncbi:MAG: DUF2865 domain-containing protein [Roseiarcus sp.]